MCKPYSIFKRHTGIYYVQFRMSDGSRSTSKSTGYRTRIEAERKAMEWVVNGQIPSRTNGKESSNSFSSVDKIKFMNDLRTSHFTDEEIRSIIKVLKERKFISSAVICKSPEDKPIEDFLLNFWDFEKSPYVKEKKAEKSNDSSILLCNNEKQGEALLDSNANGSVRWEHYSKGCAANF